MIEKIEWNGEIFALILRRKYDFEGASFITPENNPLQLGVLKYQQGTRIKPHVHRNLPRTIDKLQEVLHIEYGKIKAEFYENTGKNIGNVILNSGDTILLLSGGHGFEILEDSKIIEVKQGPYYGAEEDKERLKVNVRNEK